MILRQTGGPAIELTILGYEFPDGGVGWHDFNWLRVFVRVESGGRSWTGGPDPCLLTTEVKELSAWLRAAADGWSPPPEFLEPELSFAVVRPADERGIPVAVTLRHAFVRDQTLVSGQLSELPLVLYVEPETLRAGAADLEADLLRFPVRGTGP
jgi:hypothetical protein